MASPTDGVWASKMRPEWAVRVVQRDATAEASPARPTVPIRPAGAPDEAALIDACVAGDRQAFDQIVARHRRAVYQLCYRFAGNHEDASDLSQEVFLRAYRGLHRFKRQSSLATWLYRIGVNVCLNRASVRRPVTTPLDEARPVADQGETPSERLLRAERAARVRAAITRLPRKQRATLILRMYHELPHQEIALILGSSVGAVKANFFHALGNLKKLLGTESL